MQEENTAEIDDVAANSTGGLVRTTIVLPEDIREVGRQLAERDRRSFSNYLTKLIEADAARTNDSANKEAPAHA